MMNKILVNMNEVSNYGACYKTNDRIKSLLTDDEQILEEKYAPKIRVVDTRNYIITSNNEWCVKVENSDRRFFVLRTSSRYLGTDYYKKLAAVLKEDRVKKAFFNFITHVDISSWDPMKIPVTQTKREMKERSYNTVIQWILDVLRSKDDENEYNFNEEETKIHKNKLYEQYQQWIIKMNLPKEQIVSAIEFSRRMSNDLELTPKNTSLNNVKGSYYIISWDILANAIRKYSKDEKII